MRSDGSQSRVLRWCVSALCAVFPAAVMADPPQVLEVSIAGDRVSVTLSHPDTGWDHYADGWRVELADGTILATRPLAHPHVTEQPFTRSVSGVVFPDGVTTVFIRARCNQDGWNEAVTEVSLLGE